MATENNHAASEMPRNFLFQEDAGHGWLEVPYHVIITLNLQDKLSPFRYQHDDHLYLEEDCDALLFIRAFLRHIGENENIYQLFKSFLRNIYDGQYSPIRNYRHYKGFRL